MEAKKEDRRSISLDSIDADFDKLGINPDSINLEPKQKDMATYQTTKQGSSSVFKSAQSFTNGIDGERMTYPPMEATTAARRQASNLVRNEDELEMTPRRRALSTVEQARVPSEASLNVTSLRDNSCPDMFSVQRVSSQNFRDL